MSEVMSEDEIIDSIKPIINARKTHKDDNLYSLQLNAYQLDTIQGLLDLYQKEKERNKKFFNGEIFTRKQIEIVQRAIKEGIEEQLPKEMENFISKDKIKKELLEPIRKEGNTVNKKFFEKDKGFEIEGAILQELGAIEGMILELLEE